MAIYNDPPKKGTDKKEDVKNFFVRYYNSPTFERNFKAGQAGWLSDNVGDVRNKLLNIVKGVNVKYDKNRESSDTYYSQSGNTINMGDPSEYGMQDWASVFAHEVSHSGDPLVIGGTPNHVMSLLNKNRLYKNILQTNVSKYNAKPGDDAYDRPILFGKLFNESISGLSNELQQKKKSSELKDKTTGIKETLTRFNKWKSETQHDNAPGEVRGDINSLRYVLADKGIWDITSQNPSTFNAEMLNKLYKVKDINTPIIKKGWKETTEKRPSTIKGVEEPKTPGLILDRLRARYSDEDIIWMINNIAKQGGAKSDIA